MKTRTVADAFEVDKRLRQLVEASGSPPPMLAGVTLEQLPLGRLRVRWAVGPATTWSADTFDVGLERRARRVVVVPVDDPPPDVRAILPVGVVIADSGPNLGLSADWYFIEPPRCEPATATPANRP